MSFVNKNGLNECEKCGFAWDQIDGEICYRCANDERVHRVAVQIVGDIWGDICGRKGMTDDIDDETVEKILKAWCVIASNAADVPVLLTEIER